ncbi:MAG: hypothetical protein ACLFPR_15145 [Desulfococcaceae bacterium]
MAAERILGGHRPDPGRGNFQGRWMAQAPFAPDLGEIPGIRPPVIQRETRACLEECLAFRHVVRNAPTFQLFPSRSESLAGELRACTESVFPT